MLGERHEHNGFDSDDYSHWLDCGWGSADNTVLPVAALGRHDGIGKICVLAEGGGDLAEY